MKTREQLEKTFHTSRRNLLTAIILTIVNVFLAITNTDLNFPFSANIPLFLLYLGSELAVFTGNISFSAVGIASAFLAISFYGVCWFLSKKYRGWIVAALVFFSIDVLFILWLIFPITDGLDFSLIIELAFIGWVMYYLITGTKAWYQLKKMPPAEESEQVQLSDEIGQSEISNN